METPMDLDAIDRHVTVTVDPCTPAPVRLLHPCRCDAPDPEAARMEPLDVPLVPLLAAGEVRVTCPECEYSVRVRLRRDPA
jgi:hypothetical protein